MHGIKEDIFKANEIMRHLGRKSIASGAESPFYSFWFYDCIYLAWLKKRGAINYAVTRAHSGDLYEDHISIRGKILFRNFQLRYMDAIFPVSKMGSGYLRNKYVKAKAKIKTIFLGSADPLVLNPFNNQQYTIVSCASFRHHKRIHKIAEALLHVDIPVTWHHFGSENLDTGDPKIPEYLMRKEELKSKPNIRFIPHGYTSNEKLFDFYKNNSVNLFVSLSEAEGIPVSMMEAISFGIPVLSTDVGGCREIVTEQTGILIPLETEVREIAHTLSEFIASTKNSIEFRRGVRKFWEKNFNEHTNYREFFGELEMRN
jgi:colanic acid/amylovoran biosynthesis glycosyltransferase